MEAGEGGKPAVATSRGSSKKNDTESGDMIFDECHLLLALSISAFKHTYHKGTAWILRLHLGQHQRTTVHSSRLLIHWNQGEAYMVV